MDFAPLRPREIRRPLPKTLLRSAKPLPRKTQKGRGPGSTFHTNGRLCRAALFSKQFRWGGKSTPDVSRRRIEKVSRFFGKKVNALDPRKLRCTSHKFPAVAAFALGRHSLCRLAGCGPFPRVEVAAGLIATTGILTD
jgi:hypothetical protein